jgi:hypothetical protein
MTTCATSSTSSYTISTLRASTLGVVPHWLGSSRCVFAEAGSIGPDGDEPAAGDSSTSPRWRTRHSLSAPDAGNDKQEGKQHEVLGT